MNSMLKLSKMIFKERFKAGRMMVIWPLLFVFILFSTWGLSDPKANLPASLTIDSAYDVMYASTAFIIFSATMGAVLISFDGISRDRMTGVLELKLSQPINRTHSAIALVLGHSAAIIIPVITLNFLAIFIIRYRMGEFPGFDEFFIHLIGTALLLLWWTTIQLLASTWTKDVGASIAIGLGTWMVFTLLWLVLTSLIAGLMGIGVNDTNSLEYINLEAIIDLFSPNGVYHHLLEMPLENVERNLSPIWISLAAILWSLVPIGFLVRRMHNLNP